MNRKKYFIFRSKSPQICCLFFMMVFLGACDSNRVFDEYQKIPKEGWTYENKLVSEIDIKDTSVAYNLYFNVRNTGNYDKSNLYILLEIQSPDGGKEIKRLNFLLADKTGKWLGSGLGDLYDNQILIAKKIKLNQLGKHLFILEQNMRNNPLKEITDAGIRLEIDSE